MSVLLSLSFFLGLGYGSRPPLGALLLSSWLNLRMFNDLYLQFEVWKEISEREEMVLAQN